MTGRPRLRDDLGDLEGYHSPQVRAAVRLNTNESPFPPPPEFFEAWTAGVAQADFNRYPDRMATALRSALGGFLGQAPERLFCANGSNEVLQTLLLAYGGPGRRALVFEPSYVLHAHIARITGTGILTGERDPSFCLETAEAVRLVTDERPDVVFLTTPNNPTGIVEPKETVHALLDALAGGGGLLIVDEAYAEFSPWSALDLVDDDRALVVVRTYSKIWSMAAFRLGFGVGPGWLVDDLMKVVLPYHLSWPTQVAGTAALAFRAEMEARVAAIVAERGRVFAALAGMDGIEAFPSGANFILFRLASRGHPGPRASGGSDGPPAPADGHALWEALLGAGVLVRDFSRWPRLDGCLRVTIGRPEENDAFLTALKEALA